MNFGPHAMKLEQAIAVANRETGARVEPDDPAVFIAVLCRDLCGGGERDDLVAHKAAQRIASVASGDLRALSLAANRKAWALAVLAAVVLLIAGGAGGYLLGYEGAARRIAAADVTARQVELTEGIGALNSWSTLMRLNPIEKVLAGCKGPALATDGTGTGCWLWLRISGKGE